jgi:hypothetical protein
VAADDLPLGSAGDGFAVGQEVDFPAPPVNTDVVMELTQQDAIADAGGSAVFLVPQVVHVALGGALVAAAGPGAVLVAQDDRAADGFGDAGGVALVRVLCRELRHTLDVSVQRICRAAHGSGGDHGGSAAPALSCRGSNDVFSATFS